MDIVHDTSHCRSWYKPEASLELRSHFYNRWIFFLKLVCSTKHLCLQSPVLSGGDPDMQKLNSQLTAGAQYGKASF